jgi:hypothetical protein
MLGRNVQLAVDEISLEGRVQVRGVGLTHLLTAYDAICSLECS